MSERQPVILAAFCFSVMGAVLLGAGGYLIIGFPAVLCAVGLWMLFLSVCLTVEAYR